MPLSIPRLILLLSDLDPVFAKRAAGCDLTTPAGRVELLYAYDASDRRGAWHVLDEAERRSARELIRLHAQ